MDTDEHEHTIEGENSRKLAACFLMSTQALDMAISRPENFWAYCTLRHQQAPTAAQLSSAQRIIELLAIELAAGATITVRHASDKDAAASLLAFMMKPAGPAPGGDS